MIYKRIKKENVKIVLISLVLDRETIVIVLESFKKEIKKVVNDRLIRSSEKLESYLKITESLYKIEISLLCFRLSL